MRPKKTARMSYGSGCSHDSELYQRVVGPRGGEALFGSGVIDVVIHVLRRTIEEEMEVGRTGHCRNTQ